MIAAAARAAYCWRRSCLPPLPSSATPPPLRRRGHRGVGGARDRFDFDDTVIGVGVGLSLMKGRMRFNLAKGLNPSPEGGGRFDMLFGAPR